MSFKMYYNYSLDWKVFCLSWLLDSEAAGGDIESCCFSVNCLISKKKREKVVHDYVNILRQLSVSMEDKMASASSEPPESQDSELDELLDSKV